jgi:hypothetical protein
MRYRQTLGQTLWHAHSVLQHFISWTHAYRVHSSHSYCACLSKHLHRKFVFYKLILHIVVVAVKERKSNCNVNEKEVSILVAISKRRNSINCSGLTKT